MTATGMHGGPIHEVRSKADLARHVGEDHEGPDGRVHRVAWPAASTRARWTREELEATHRGLHPEIAA